MKSLNPHSTAGRSLGLFLSLILAGSAYAGPGIQYWQSLGKSEVNPATPTKPEGMAANGCAGSKLVAVTVMKASWPNGRAPLQEVQIGTKRECQSCGATATVMKSSWANGRGPLSPVQAASLHDCGSSCGHATHA
jgi:hypothetical protein